MRFNTRIQKYGPHADLLNTDEIKGLRWLFHQVEMPIVIVTAEMELTGVAVDEKYGERLKLKYNKQLETLDHSIDKLLSRLSPLIDQWRLSAQANERAKIYVSAKSKMSADKIEKMYPLVDKDGARYKIGKAAVEQLKLPINLASPTQLAILFYDILKAPQPSKSNARGTGEEDLQTIVSNLQNQQVVFKMANSISNCLLEVKDQIAETNTISSNKIIETSESMEVVDMFDTEEEQPTNPQEELEEEIDDTDEDSLSVSSEVKIFDISSKEIITNQFFDLIPVIIDLANAILKRRGIVKLITTYIDVIPSLVEHWPDHRIRFHLNALGTDTGRYSSGGKLKFMENDVPIVVSGINIQNIPSHNPEIRMLFKAQTTDHVVELTDNYYEIPETDEVETTAGWKKAKDLIIGDTLIGKDNKDTVINIVKNNNVYLLYI